MNAFCASAFYDLNNPTVNVTKSNIDDTRTKVVGKSLKFFNEEIEAFETIDCDEKKYLIDFNLVSFCFIKYRDLVSMLRSSGIYFSYAILTLEQPLICVKDSEVYKTLSDKDRNETH